MTEGLFRSSSIKEGVPLTLGQSNSIPRMKSRRQGGQRDISKQLSLPQQQTYWVKSQSFDEVNHSGVASEKEISKERSKTDPAILIEPIPFIDRESTPLDSGGLEQRIQAKRKQRHDYAIAAKNLLLEKLNETMQEQVVDACQQLTNHLSETQTAISNPIDECQNNQKYLISATREDIERIKKNIEKKLKMRRKAVEEFITKVTAIEEKRTFEASSIFSSCASELHSIAFLLPAEVGRLIQNESLEMNMTIITNKKHYMELYQSLMKEESLVLKDSLEKWNKVLNTWSKEQRNVFINQFREYIEQDDPILDQQFLECLRGDQKLVLDSRMNLLSQMSNVKPCKHNKAIVTQLKESYHKTVEKLDNIHATFLRNWKSAQERTYNKFKTFMHTMKENMIILSILDEAEANQFELEKLLPFIKKFETVTNERFESLKQSLALISSTHNNMFTSLLQHVQGAAHILDSCFAQIETIKCNWEIRLSSARKDHDVQNQTMEANHDVILDRLRQSGTNEESDEFNRMAQELLRAIKERYIIFHDDMINLCSNYPLEIKDELAEYDMKLCEYFGVNRDPQQTKKKSKSRATASGRITAKLTPTKSPSSKPPSSAQSPATPHHYEIQAMLTDVLSTSNGTSFYICSERNSKKDANQSSSTFVTQDKDIDCSSACETECLIIEDYKFTEAKRSFCLKFLEHMENMKEEVLQQTEEMVNNKIAELRTELELRLHLHKPRPSRVKQDIYDVRKAELIAHQERLTLHVKGISHTMQEQKDSVQELPEKLEKMYATMSKELEEYKDKLMAIKSCLSLNVFLKEVKDAHKTLVQEVEEIVSTAKLLATETFNDLLVANTQYMASVRLFSEGGNYCKSEIEAISARLDKQIDRINKANRAVLASFETIEEAIPKRTTEIYTSMFGARFQYHLVDVTLLETINAKLAHCQVLIKTEVLSSNAQSEAILKSISCLTDSNLKEVSSFVEMLPSLFKPFHDRVGYLYCHSKAEFGSLVGGTDVVTIATEPLSAITLKKDINQTCAVNKEDHTKVVQPTPLIPSFTVDAAKSVKKPSNRKKQQQIDRKHVTYGIGGGKDGEKCFLPKIRSLLTSTHEDLYTIIEDYYRIKGNRPVMRKDEIPDMFEQMMDIQIDRLHKYRIQAENYRNKCIDELHQQLELVYSTLGKVIECLYSHSLCHGNQTRDSTVNQLLKRYTFEKAKNEKTKADHDKALRPSLGHPSKESLLLELCDNETKRTLQFIDTINETKEKIKEAFYSHSRNFILNIVDCTNVILKALDSNCLAPSDLVPSSQKPVPKYDLLKSLTSQKGKITKDVAGDERVQFPLSVWPPVKEDTLTFGNKEIDNKIHVRVSKKMDTMAHRETITVRDQTLHEYKLLCVDSLEKWNVMFDSEHDKEKKVQIDWEKSVTAIKQLYTSC